jgi:hypothetical protein
VEDELFRLLFGRQQLAMLLHANHAQQQLVNGANGLLATPPVMEGRKSALAQSLIKARCRVVKNALKMLTFSLATL